MFLEDGISVESSQEDRLWCLQMSDSSLKCVQLNMGRASAVNDQLLDYCQKMAIDIALVQEPYTNRGILSGLEVAPFRCFLSKATRRRGRTEYLDHGAAIIVFNPELVVASREVNTMENFVSLDLDCGEDGVVTLINGYFKYRTPTAIHVTASGTLVSGYGQSPDSNRCECIPQEMVQSGHRWQRGGIDYVHW